MEGAKGRYIDCKNDNPLLFLYYLQTAQKCGRGLASETVRQATVDGKEKILKQSAEEIVITTESNIPCRVNECL